ncbi:hypothetical protein AUR64_04045 [Haloprofundus marisrubri]|uniref:Uncharacterized protein n=1 Tax=Haloprofundus marisrubri TaxID=1514971 RepID=A0A0W1RCX9_9EURY|nr:phosphoribosyltransferase [Haloprofundus marisrubri]KTG11434.1 hypothetical protein AUR64_04045 [Haloprofundus marisrubri]
MAVELTYDDLLGLRTDEDEDPDSTQIATKLNRLQSHVEDVFEDKSWFEAFKWDGSPGSPYIGPPNSNTSEYVWLGLSHETYQSLGKPSGGLQFEFGIDGGSARGFFNRNVLCGLYFGPWANDESAAEIASKLQEHSTEIASFLNEHPAYILCTKNDIWRNPDAGLFKRRSESLSKGFTITVDHSLKELPLNLSDVVCDVFHETMPLYWMLADIDQPTDYNPRGPHTGSSDGGEDGGSTDPTVKSIAALSSTLDSNDIESSVESLTKRGIARKEALQYVQEYVIDTQRGQGLYAVKGLGPVAGYRFAQAGITTLEELETQSFDDLKSVYGLRESQARTIWEEINSEDPPTGSGPKREPGTPTDTDPEPGEDSEIVVNQLSEYYEALRSVRKVVSTIMLRPETPIRPDDLTDPCVQYFVLLETCLGDGNLDLVFSGYGQQHKNRLPFSMEEYRQQFGTGRWVTEYNSISVEPYQKASREWLEDNTMLKDIGQFVRPIAPETETPLPEFVQTPDDLRYAISVLNQLPAYPPLPTENGSSNRTIPAKELYAELFAELNDDEKVDIQTIPEPHLADRVPVTGPVPDATPETKDDTWDFMLNYGKMTHLFRRLEPASDSPIQRSVPVFALDWYNTNSESFDELRALAKLGEDDPVPIFRRRLRDLINRRFLRDDWNYDFITVFPGHEKDSLSPQLVELAKDAVDETPITYSPMLERTETTGRQREKSREEREVVANDPNATLRTRTRLDGESVIILDDIATSGSSLLAGAHLLREAGASGIFGVTLGLTPGDDDAKLITQPETYASEIISGVE